MKNIILLLGILLLTSNFCFANSTVQVNNGRYVMYQHPTFRGDQYILDSQTGKVWLLVKTKEGLTVWEEMFFDCYKDDKTYSGRFTIPR